MRRSQEVKDGRYVVLTDGTTHFECQEKKEVTKDLDGEFLYVSALFPISFFSQNGLILNLNPKNKLQRVQQIVFVGMQPQNLPK